MRSRIPIFILIWLLWLEGPANIAIYIYYNTDDCVACINLLPLFRKLDPQFEKTMVVTKKTEPILNELLVNHHYKYSDFKWKYVEDDYFLQTINNRISVIPSYCLVYRWGMKEDSFLLKNLSSNISKLTSILPCEIKLSTPSFHITIPDSLKFSDRINFQIAGNYINIKDDVLNKNILLLLNKEKTKISKVFTTKGKDMDIYSFLKNNCFDTVAYRRYEYVYRSMGVDIPTIQSAFITDSAFHLLISLYYPRIRGEDSTLLTKTFLYSRSLLNSEVKINCLSTDGVSERMQGRYVISPSMPFIVKGNQAFFSVNDHSDPLEREFLSEFSLSGTQPAYIGIMPNTTGPFKYPKKSKGYMLNKRVTSRFYFSTEYPYFYDYINDEQFKLNPDDFVFNYHRDYYLQDIIREGKDIYILASFGKDLIRYRYNAEKKMVTSEPVNYNKDWKVSHVKFVTASSYVLLNNRDIVFFNH